MNLTDKVAKLQNSAALLLPSVRLAEQERCSWSGVLRSLQVVEDDVRAVRTTIRVRLRAEIKAEQAKCPHPAEKQVPCHVVGGIARQMRCTCCDARLEVAK